MLVFFLPPCFPATQSRTIVPCALEQHDTQTSPADEPARPAKKKLKKIKKCIDLYYIMG